jgi:FPC/CPF motif-containing protein YcgG
LEQFYPCTGAISALNNNSYRFGLYPELGGESAVRAVCHDLYCFCHEFTSIDDHFATFIAMFRGPAIRSERHFEDLLWNQLQGMHDLDSDSFTWDKDVESDPASPHFSYSIGGRSMFVIGMHPKASRLARTFPYPTVMFNLHEQFERLRARKVRGDETDDTGARDDVPRFDQPHAVELRRKLRGASIFRPSCVR